MCTIFVNYGWICDSALDDMKQLLDWCFSSSAGEDYTDVLATVYFRPDHTPSAVIRVSITDDSLREGVERFTVQLKNFDVSIVLANSVAEIVIEDDDGRHGVAIVILFQTFFV